MFCDSAFAADKRDAKIKYGTLLLREKIGRKRYKPIIAMRINIIYL